MGSTVSSSLISPAAAGVSPAPVLPLRVKPMLAQAAEGPLDSADFAYEVKWDGMRVLVGLDGERVAMCTRNGLDASLRFPELREVRSAVRSERAILDGEIVRLADGKPDFGTLQHRMHLSDPQEIRRRAEAEPAALILFDMLRDGDEPLTDQPWQARRERLEACLTPGPVIQLSPVWEDGRPLLELMGRMGLEGVMAKRRQARYTPGRRSDGWLKIKTASTVDLVVGGWTEGSGGRQTGVGALVVGAYEGSRFVCVGSVGSGIDWDLALAMPRLLAPLAAESCPFGEMPDTNARPHWLRPGLVCEVRHMGWSHTGKLRFPVFVRWRPDKGAGECRLADLGRPLTAADDF